jgi:hypothetical protein
MDWRRCSVQFLPQHFLSEKQRLCYISLAMNAATDNASALPTVDARGLTWADAFYRTDQLREGGIKSSCWGSSLPIEKSRFGLIRGI